MASGTPARMNCQKFLEYIRAFDKRDYKVQHSFYSNNVQLILPDPAIPPLKGKDAIMAHYAPIHAAADEMVVPIVVMCDGKRVWFHMHAYFQYKQDVDKAVHDFQVKKGDILKIDNAAVYEIDENGLMERIECRLFGMDLLGQVDVKKYIKESESLADPEIRLFNY
ncbi:hypothetical protein MKZ38_009713 [Zalerion maritima]|uniref:SnoaL-like domain-containing protein n=1 Tax=Zalerion maritima TaxID=339359 RepID=A0AAD5RGX9_9PEZI|nr:hypothetical protein MKZ38_009713 [Zalerion maritima]